MMILRGWGAGLFGSKFSGGGGRVLENFPKS